LQIKNGSSFLVEYLVKIIPGVNIKTFKTVVKIIRLSLGDPSKIVKIKFQKFMTKKR